MLGILSSKLDTMMGHRARQSSLPQRTLISSEQWTDTGSLKHLAPLLNFTWDLTGVMEIWLHRLKQLQVPHLYWPTNTGTGQYSSANDHHQSMDLLRSLQTLNIWPLCFISKLCLKILTRWNLTEEFLGSWLLIKWKYLKHKFE